MSENCHRVCTVQGRLITLHILKAFWCDDASFTPVDVTDVATGRTAQAICEEGTADMLLADDSVRDAVGSVYWQATGTPLPSGALRALSGRL